MRQTGRQPRSGFILLLLIAVCLLSISACAPRLADTEVADLRRLSQNPVDYLDPATADLLLFSRATQEQQMTLLLDSFFAPWRASTPLETTRQPFWAVDWVHSEPVFGMNLRRVAEEQLEALVAQSAPERYPSLDRKAISLRRCNLRALPTTSPLFKNPDQAGEGFPFDLLQHSALAANVPLHVTHRSIDGNWLFVETSQVYGWLPTSDLAWVDEVFMRGFTTGHYRALTEDQVPVFDEDGLYRFSAGIGSLFPVANPELPEIQIAVADEQQQAVLVRAYLPVDQSASFPLLPTPRRFAALATEMLGQPYDWGGQRGYRDCSATIQDLFAPFGLWLPRNSSKQAEQGAALPLVDLAPALREQRLLADGVPFLTLVALPGHIMLYLGEVDGRAVLLHTLWGVRTETLLGREGRWRVGRTVITTLEPGREGATLWQSVSSLRDRVTSMNLLTEE